MNDTIHGFFESGKNPFDATPDPRFLVPTQNVRRTVAELAQAIHARKGLILLTGEVGTGKTILIRLLLEHLSHQGIPRAFIFNSHLNANDLFRLALAEFGVPLRSNTNVTPVARFQNWLAQPERLTGNAVLIIDEAQGLSFEVLEEVRLVLNMDSAHGKALQVILAGQPELDEKLKRPEFRAIRQRISTRCTTMPLSRGEADEFITGRLRIAGATGAIEFPSETADLLYLYSRGVPRVLNLLCDHSSMRARAARSQSVSLETVEEVVRQLQFDDARPVAPTARLNCVVAAGGDYHNPDPIAMSFGEPQAPSVGHFRKKFSAMGFPESLISRPAAVASTAEAEGQNGAEVLRLNVAPLSEEEGESVEAGSYFAPTTVSREEKQPPETRCVIECPTSDASSRPVHPVLVRIKQHASRLRQSAMSVAGALIRRGRPAKTADPKPGNQPFELILRWFQEPMRSDKARRGLARTAPATRPAGR